MLSWKTKRYWVHFILVLFNLLMTSITLDPIAKVEGHISLPGSKSLSNRALLLAALARGTTTISNLLMSDDITHMLTALRQLGVQCEFSDNKTECIVEGKGSAFIAAKPVHLFLGNAGTAMRPLCAALCLGGGEFILSGEPRMEERPIKDLVDSLLQAGADIEYLKSPGYPPLHIKARGLAGGSIKVDGSVSSQFLTALLMALPVADHDSEIHIIGELVSKPYIDMTLWMMEKFGVSVVNDAYQCFRIGGKQVYQSPGSLLVEGDASSASYFLAAAAIKGGTVKVAGVGQHSIQGDIRFADVLEKMGAKIVWGQDSITVSRGRLAGVDMDLNHIPDAAMTLATTALFAEGSTTIRNIYNWRVKETDRLSAMATELRKLGCDVIEGEDFIKISPPLTLKHAVIDTYDDHRMAMCFSLAALGRVPITINDPDCTSKTFPDYFEQLATICQHNVSDTNK